MNTKLTYELTFDLRDSDSTEYEQWLSQQSIHWVSHPTVASFEVRETTVGSARTVRVILGFRSMEDWQSFVESDEHTNAKTTLDRVTTRMDGTLWERSSLDLNLASDDRER